MEEGRRPDRTARTFDRVTSTREEESEVKPEMSFVKAVCLVLMMVLSQAASRARKIKRSSDVEETVPLRLDFESLAPLTSSRPLNRVSISPWTYNTTFDPSIYPPNLSEARCLLTGCLSSNGSEDSNLESKPIMRQILVLRRVGRANSNHTYRLESRNMAVGCTCVRPIVLKQIPQ